MKSARQRLLRHPVVLLFVVVLYKGLVDLAYADTYHFYAYWGLFEWQPKPASIALGWALALVSTPVIYYCLVVGTLSSSIFLVLVLCAWYPFTALVGHRADYPFAYIVAVSIYWLILSVSYRVIPVLSVAVLRKKAIVFLYPAVALLVFAVVYVWATYAGMHLQFHLFEGLYEQRALAREYAVPGYLGYVLIFADNFLPVVMLYFFLKKKPLLGGILAVVIFLNFSITASKQLIFLLAIALLAGIFRKIRFTNQKVFIALLVLLAASLIEHLLFDSIVLNALLPYRIMFIPSELHYSYFTFFSEGGFDFYRQGPLKFFFASEYSTGIAFLVGEQAIGDLTARANNGLFSAAFMNLGYIGAILSPWPIAIFLRILDGAAAFTDNRLRPILIAYVSFVMIGIPLYTAALSSGFIGLILFLYLMGDYTENRIGGRAELVK
ncbi:hypothetical protein N9S00_04760 [Luminiphilus sp.]|nr:hypothetical protein [Luminiphilus sp.]